MKSGNIASFKSIVGRKTQHHAMLENHNTKNKLDSYFYGDKKF